MVRIVSGASLLCAFTGSNAYAYIDPGTGGMILQAVAATAVSLVVAVRLYWAKLRALFKPDNSKK